MIRLCMVLIALLSFPLCAVAQQSQNWSWCRAENATPFDLQVNGCTAIIQSGRESKQNLASAYCSRGIAYYNNGQTERAVGDLQQSFKLRSTGADAYRCRGISFEANATTTEP